MGKVSYTLTEKEKKSLVFKRSLFVVKDIKKGEVFTPEHIRSVRPSSGLHTRYFDVVIGKKARRDIASGTPLQFGLVDHVFE